MIYNKLHSFMPFIYMQTGVNWQEKEREIVALKLLKRFTTRGVLRDLQISIFVCPGQGLDVWTVGPGGGRRERSCFEVEVIYSRRQPSSGVSGGGGMEGPLEGGKKGKREMRRLLLIFFTLCSKAH